MSTPARVVSLDAMRGLIMVLMAIDHASLMVARRHSAEFWGVPLPVYADGLSFLTRAITHLCAPGFFLLMGAGMAMFAASRAERAGWSGRRIARFFVSRGVLLMVLQQVLENPAWALNQMTTAPEVIVERGGVAGGGTPVFLHFGVLYALGASMALWGVLVRLPSHAVAALSGVAVLTTQLLLPPAAESATLFPALTRLVLVPGHSNAVQVFYPLLPWVGVTGFGLLLGRALTGADVPRVLRRTTLIGAVLLAAFVAIRLGDGFGNLHPRGDGWIGFLNVTKYPPSLAFLTLTLGIDLLLLGVLESMRDRLGSPVAQPLLVFGRTALFFYVLHLYVYLALGLLVPGGTSTAGVYAAWLLGLVALYPICLLYERFRRTTPIESMWRLF